MRTIRVGTRGSQLALTQTGQVVESLKRQHPGITFETVIIKTTGDQRQNIPFSAVGTKGMFVKELEEALLAGEIHFAVHSLKDMPGELADGLSLAAVPTREDPRDAYLSGGTPLNQLKEGARVGTSSIRRQILLKHLRPDLQVDELRGNLDTRIRKLDEGQYDAIILACAGLDRMGWSERITERLAAETFIPAPGQGALALEIRTDDAETSQVLSAIHDLETADAVAAERAFQATLSAGCSVPAGAYARVTGEDIEIVAFLSETDGSQMRKVTENGARTDAAAIGREAANRLLGMKA